MVETTVISPIIITIGGLSTRKKSVKDLTRVCVLQEGTVVMIIDAWSVVNLVMVNTSVGKRI